ncbi:MAG TPA: ATP-binding protein [Limnobacter sp.]|nr:ATP-binding protein [Limnobacter sp.]
MTEPTSAPTDQYSQVLHRFVLAGNGHDSEQSLADAFELGRKFVEQSVPPDELVLIHHHALLHLAKSHPEMTLAEVADKLTAPLLETSMAYVLAFRKQTEENLNRMVRERYERTSRLQAVATLAAGIAHDFNNIIGGIWGYAELLHDDSGNSEPTRRKLEQIMTGCGRARDLVNRMLTFARNQPGTPQSVNLNQQVKEALELLSPFLKAGISLQLAEQIDQAQVHAAPGVIQQVIMNLCLNANDAIDGAGHIQVNIDAQGKSGAVLKVRDTGSGMPPEIIEQIYNPFFTTKEPGRGSGLGLSVVHGIVHELGGSIDVRSECSGPGRGTEFSLFIPLQQTADILETVRTTDYGQHTAD